jgi:hypothetical protein
MNSVTTPIRAENPAMDFVERPSRSFKQSALNRDGTVSLMYAVWWSIAILATTLHGAAPAAQGRFNNPGPSGPILCQAGCHPMFSNWLYCVARPIVCQFETQPDTTYQVFIGLTEVHWDRAGQRVVDLEVAGQTVATVDTFQQAQATPHGYVIRGASDAEGRLTIRILPHPGSPDQNPVVCGVLLYAGDTSLDVDAIIHNRGPQPLVSLLAGPDADGMQELLKNRGVFFAKKKYEPEPLPTFAATKAKLPAPVFDENPEAVRCYWKAWELAFSHFRQPAPGSPFVSNYIDENFNSSLFLWDTAFMTMFCNYAHPLVPGIQSLDNFYCTQLADGEIVREVSELTGVPHPASRPGTADSLNHPILAWAEREAYRLSGDRERLARVFEPLRQYYRAYEKIRDEDSGFYATSWASMDNSPRLDGGQLACGIDTTAEMVLFARDLAYLAGQLGRTDDAAKFEADAVALSAKINARLWDESTGFYYDWARGGKRHDVRTIAGFWTLLAGVATPAQAERLVAHLQNTAQFCRQHRVPTVSADQSGFHPAGDYWRGAVWTPTNMMVVRGLERYGYDALAREIALNHLENIVEVFTQTGTIWENYAPDSAEPGKPAKGDFVGWSGIGPIVFLIEYAIGLKPDAQADTLTWNLASTQRVGCERLRFGRHLVDLLAVPDGNQWHIRVRSDGEFTLTLTGNGQRREYPVKQGDNTFTWPEP